MIATLLLISTVQTAKANEWQFKKNLNESAELTGYSDDLNAAITLVCYPKFASIILTGTSFYYGNYLPGAHWQSQNLQYSGELKSTVTDSGAALDLILRSIDELPFMLLLRGMANSKILNLSFNTKTGELVKKIKVVNAHKYLNDFITTCKKLQNN